MEKFNKHSKKKILEKTIYFFHSKTSLQINKNSNQISKKFN